MSEKIYLNKKVYAKNQYQRVIDTQFSQLATSPSETPSEEIPIIVQVNQFFQDYQKLLFDIPKTGSINSHEYLIKTSTSIIGSTIPNEEIIALIDEINVLQQQNLELNQQLVELRTTGSI